MDIFDEESLCGNLYTYGTYKKFERNGARFLGLSLSTFLFGAFNSDEDFQKILFGVSIIASLSTIGAGMLLYLKRNKYERTIKRLDDIDRQLCILGYEIDSFKDSCDVYREGVIAFLDRYDNEYYLYEDEDNEYYILYSDSLENCLDKGTKRENITKIIREKLK